MYTEHFGLEAEPFSIAPDPRFLFLSEAHNEALAHLMYGFTHGGFVLITGEVGTGKTTLLRNLLDRTPPELDVAFVLNPRLTVRELLETLCDELGVPYNTGEVQSVKQYIDILNRHLLQTHQMGRSTVVIIDEAQNLSPAVLEQIRLLTNLETNERKLLRIILLGQPELAEMLARNELRQLAQRITARYHLEPLRRQDIRAYVDHRLRKAGGQPYLFHDSAIRALYRVSKGTPRLINIIADRALLGAYVEGVSQVTESLVNKAAKEVLDQGAHRPPWYKQPQFATAAVAAILILLLASLWLTDSEPDPATTNAAATTSTTPTNSVPKNTIPVTSDSAPIGQTESSVRETTQQRRGENTLASEPESPTIIAAQRQPTAAGSSPSVQYQSQKQSENQAQFQTQTPIDLSRPSLSPRATQRKAYQAVYSLWGNTYPLDSPDIPCNFAPQAGLQCLARRGGWSELNQLNTPVILELWDDGPRPYHAALLEKQADKYLLQLGDRSMTVSPKDLRDSWFGAYVILWQTPPNYLGSLRQGDEHPTVAWLHSRLNEIMPESANSGPDNLFDAALHDQVVAFQTREGLLADGIVGPLTWIRISDRLNLPAPKLDTAS
ncbi:MAG: AAA family ATPase [Pseudomonadota bacterium]